MVAERGVAAEVVVEVVAGLVMAAPDVATLVATDWGAGLESAGRGRTGRGQAGGHGRVGWLVLGAHGVAPHAVTAVTELPEIWWPPRRGDGRVGVEQPR